jgi:Terminase RNaseH-like domain
MTYGFCLGRGSVADLSKVGTMLDGPAPYPQKTTMGAFLAEALLKVRDRRGKWVPLAANRAQREYDLRRGQSNIVLKARQMGITTWVAGRFFLKTITQPGTLTVQVAHTQAAAEGIFRCVHRFLRGLPSALRYGALKTGRASARQIVFPALDSEYRVETAGDPNAGRGATIQNLHCSEVARWPGDAQETLAGLRAALPPCGELVLESTPNGADGCFFEEWQRASATAGGENLVGHFFPWWWESEYAAEPVAEEQWTDEERQFAAWHELGGAQIGFRRRLEAGFRGLARQEYAEDADACFLASGACVFDLEALDARLKSLGEPVSTRDGGELLVWNYRLPEHEYLVAADPAGGGVDGDYSAAQVLDLATGLQCAELQGKMTALELAERIARLGHEYGKASLVVERNNHGSGVLAYLKSVCRYPHVYKQDEQDGWLTSSLSRPAMIGRLAAALVEKSSAFQSRRLLKECRSFVRLRNGKTGAQQGAHDDCVMAMAIALSAREELLVKRRVRRTG